MKLAASIDQDGNVVITIVIAPGTTDLRHFWGELGDLLKEISPPDPVEGGF